MTIFRSLLFVVVGASAAHSQSWEFSTKPPQDIGRSASLKTDAGEIVALWRSRAGVGDEIITYHDFTEVGSRRIQYFYNGVLNNSLVVRKAVYYTYRSGFKGEPYYGPEEMLYFPASRSGHFELRSEHFRQLWFRAAVVDAGRLTLTAQATSPSP